MKNDSHATEAPDVPTTSHAVTDVEAEEHNYAEEVNGLRGGFNVAMGLTFSVATPSRVVASLEVGDAHLQPYGLVHGGVYAGIIETTCSTGAALAVLPRGQTAVGLDNSTSFLRAVRGGTLTVEATPLARGGRSHVWQGRVTDTEGRLAAIGRVRLLVLDPGAEAAGESVALQQSPTGEPSGDRGQ